eukprot:COSAG04_NODE_8542_length_960_cov_1.085947_2_plen_171_part_01
MDKCFTTSNNAVYVIYLHWPEVKGASPHTALVSLDHLVPTAATTVSLLGDPRTAITHSVTGGRFEFEVPDTCDPLRPFFATIYGVKCLRVRACVYDVARRRPCVVSWISATRSSSRSRGDSKRVRCFANTPPAVERYCGCGCGCGSGCGCGCGCGCGLGRGGLGGRVAAAS